MRSGVPPSRHGNRLLLSGQDDVDEVLDAARQGRVACQQRGVKAFGECDVERVMGRAHVAQLPRTREQRRIQMTENAKLRKLLASALGYRQLDLRTANETSKRLCHLHVDQTGRVYVAEHPGAFRFGSLAEQVCGRARCVDDPSHPRRPFRACERLARGPVADVHCADCVHVAEGGAA
jgi:hypothetical protein